MNYFLELFFFVVIIILRSIFNSSLQFECIDLNSFSEIYLVSNSNSSQYKVSSASFCEILSL